VLVLDIVLLRWYLKRQNDKKDALAAEGAGDAHLVHAFEDLTDRENKTFRYIY
jgi:hypothetical protein